MSEKTTDIKHEASAAHDEHVGTDILGILSTPIEYDNDKITRSPYVFGAALLASFGGFSFGYGKSQRHTLVALF